MNKATPLIALREKKRRCVNAALDSAARKVGVFGYKGDKSMSEVTMKGRRHSWMVMWGMWLFGCIAGLGLRGLIQF